MEPECWVRVWHDKRECERSGKPVLVVTYRLAFENLTGSERTPFRVVFYNAYARQRVQSVNLTQGFLCLALRPEPFLGSQGNRGKMKKIVALGVDRHPHQNVTSVVVSIAYALSRYDPFRMGVTHGGESTEWIQDAFLLGDDDVESSSSSATVPDGLDVCLEFKPRLFRCLGFH